MRHLIFVLLMAMAITAHCQVGYQVSLLDTKTGEPRTNEKVSVTITISDSKGNTICDEKKTVTSDAFGVLSMTVGNNNTFANVNWQNLPLKISATVDGILIGSSDILTVPVAEYAKRTGVLTPEILNGMTVTMYDDCTLTFSANGIALYDDSDPNYSCRCRFEIDGNNVYVYRPGNNTSWVFHYSVNEGKLYKFDD